MLSEHGEIYKVKKFCHVLFCLILHIVAGVKTRRQNLWYLVTKNDKLSDFTKKALKKQIDAIDSLVNNFSSFIFRYCLQRNHDFFCPL